MAVILYQKTPRNVNYRLCIVTFRTMARELTFFPYVQTSGALHEGYQTPSCLTQGRYDSCDACPPYQPVLSNQYRTISKHQANSRFRHHSLTRMEVYLRPICEWHIHPQAAE